MTSLSGRDMIPRFFRLLILLPAAAYCVFHTFLSMISSFVIPFTRVHIVLILFPFFNVFSALMMLPKLIGFLFENLPFFNFEARFMSGYQNGLTVIYMLLMNMIFTLIDHILPPSPPNSEDNFRKRVYAEWYDQEMKHPISVWT
ncbi:hypothetical protein MHBO_001805 [Bonamia ostreae]|uniref:Uncharacterized protein n=1 Tax=Bonamia ostreae TaxID=126728 RepID=A0ABV2AK85_9EUKA